MIAYIIARVVDHYVITIGVGAARSGRVCNVRAHNLARVDLHTEPPSSSKAIEIVGDGPRTPFVPHERFILLLGLGAIGEGVYGCAGYEVPSEMTNLGRARSRWAQGVVCRGRH